MARAVFRLCYQPGRRFRHGRSQSHRLQRRFAWFFWRDIDWFEHVEDALHRIASMGTQRRESGKPDLIATFDANGQELT